MRSEWQLLSRLGLALVLSTVIGLEREWRQKSAGLRTYTLVGLGSALFLLVNPLLARRLPRSGPAPLRITYADGRGVLREALARVTGAGFAVSDVSFERDDQETVTAEIAVRGREPLTSLVTELGEVEGVLSVRAVDAEQG